MSTAGNEPAYPLDSSDYRLNGWRGLSKRELFAAMAMQGLSANSYLLESANGNDVGPFVCQAAVALADALIAELAKATP